MNVTFLNYNYNISLKINLMCLWLRNLRSSYLHTEMVQCQIPGEIQEVITSVIIYLISYHSYIIIIIMIIM
jgi:hypothetical protein